MSIEIITPIGMAAAVTAFAAFLWGLRRPDFSRMNEQIEKVRSKLKEQIRKK